MVWFGEVVEEDMLGDLSTESSRQKGQHALEKFEGESSVWTNPASQQDCWDQPAPRNSPVNRVKSDFFYKSNNQIAEISQIREKTLIRKKWENLKIEKNRQR